jgi:hypothetical protein
MPKNRIIIGLGVLIALMPFLGFPRAWENIFQIAVGLSIVLLSILIALDKRITQKVKARTRQAARKRTGEVAGTSHLEPGSVDPINISDFGAVDSEEDTNLLNSRSFS